MWEMAQIYGKWLEYLINGLSMWELTQRFSEMAKIFVKWLKYLRYGIGMLQMT